MTIADRIRKLAEDSSVPGDLYEHFLNIAKAIDADSFLIHEQINSQRPDFLALREIANHLGEPYYAHRR